MSEGYQILNAFYGLGSLRDVTYILFSEWRKNGPVTIPDNDEERVELFRDDPAPGEEKILLVFYQDGDAVGREIISVGTEIIAYFDPETVPRQALGYDLTSYPNQRLSLLYTNLCLYSPNEELTWITGEIHTQKSLISELTGDETILEIGGHVGRTAMVASSTLYDDANLVTLEPNPSFFEYLEINKKSNGLSFQILNKKLSKGETKLEEVKSLVSNPFDTLIITCEGAFAQILREFPEILKGIKLVFIENDFKTKGDLEFVTKSFTQNGLKCTQSLPLDPYYQSSNIPESWGRFYEIWRS